MVFFGIKSGKAKEGTVSDDLKIGIFSSAFGQELGQIFLIRHHIIEIIGGGIGPGRNLVSRILTHRLDPEIGLRQQAPEILIQVLNPPGLDVWLVCLKNIVHIASLVRRNHVQIDVFPFLTHLFCYIFYALIDHEQPF